MRSDQEIKKMAALAMRATVDRAQAVAVGDAAKVEQLSRKMANLMGGILPSEKAVFLAEINRIVECAIARSQVATSESN